MKYNGRASAEADARRASVQTDAELGELFKRWSNCDLDIPARGQRLIQLTIELIDATGERKMTDLQIIPFLTALKRDDWNPNRIRNVAKGLFSLSQPGWRK